MKLIAGLLLIAGAAFASPVAVSGSGTFDNDPFDGVNAWTVHFSGSNGTDEVMASWETGAHAFGNPIGGSIICCDIAGFSPTGGATIDGIHFNPGFFSFSIGGDAGGITGFDAGHNPVISLDLTGWITASATCVNETQNSRACSGTFIIHTPEPAAWSVMLGGLSLLALMRVTTRRIY